MSAIEWRSIDVASWLHAVTSTMLGVVTLDAQWLEVHQVEAEVGCPLQRNAVVNLCKLACITNVGLASSTTILVQVQ